MAEARTTNNAVSFRDEILKLINHVDKSYFKLGEKLSRVVRGGLFQPWGFDSFEEYVEGELGFARRKAYYLIQIYERSVQLDLSAATLERIGWTKAKTILAWDGIDSKEKFEEWADRSMTMSVSELQGAINSAAMGKPTPKKGKDADGNKTVEIDGEVFHEVKVYLSDAQYENVKLAFQRGGQIAQSDKMGHVLDMICLDFLANNTTLSAMGQKLAEWANRGFIILEEQGTEPEEDPSKLVNV